MNLFGTNDIRHNVWYSYVRMIHCIYWGVTGYRFKKNLSLKIYFVLANSASCGILYWSSPFWGVPGLQRVSISKQPRPRVDCTYVHFSHTQSMEEEECSNQPLAPLVMSAWVFIWVLAHMHKNSKTCLKRPLKNRQNKDLYDKWQLNEGWKYSRMLPLVESIAECSHWSILQYFWPALSDNWS